MKWSRTQERRTQWKTKSSRTRLKIPLSTDQEIREGDDALNDEPLKTVAEEAQEGSHEHDGPQWEIHEGDAGAPSKGLAHVRGHREVVELDLRYTEHRLEVRRVGWEVEVGPRECLYPGGCHQYHPLPRLPNHISRQRHSIQMSKERKKFKFLFAVSVFWVFFL